MAGSELFSASMAPKSTGQGRSRSPSRGNRQGDSPSRKSDSSKKSSGSSYESSESVKSKDSRKGPPTHPPIVHPEPAPPGYVRIKGALVRDQGEKWTPPRETAPKDENIVSIIPAPRISVMAFSLCGNLVDSVLDSEIHFASSPTLEQVREGGRGCHERIPNHQVPDQAYLPVRGQYTLLRNSSKCDRA
jgi:hypothetical protein